DDPRTERCGFHHAAVEKQMRRTHEPAGTAADDGRRGRGHVSVGCLARQESREVTCDGGIRGIWKPQLLQPHGRAPRRHLAGGNRWKEAVDEHLVQIVAVKLTANGASDQTGSFAEDRYRMYVLVGPCEQRLLGQTALVP